MHPIKRFINEFIAEYSVLFFWVIIFIIVMIGTISFYLAEPRDLFHSFYFTTITMATVWYGDMAPVTYLWKILAIIYGFMWAPLFIWLTWILFQSKFQKLIKHSIHSYHKEIKEAQDLALANKKEIEKEQKEIKKIHEEVSS